MTDDSHFLHAHHKHYKYLKYLYALLALSAGITLPFAFAPFGMYLLAIVAITALLFTWIKATSAKQALLYGWLFGLGYFGIGASWIYISLHDYGSMSPSLSAIITALFVAFLACYPATAGYLLTKFFPQNQHHQQSNWHKLLLAFPAIFTLCEWVRGWLFSGFPWLFLGYSQIDSPLRGITPIFGVYGVSFAVAFTAGCIIYFWQISSTTKITEPKKTQQQLLLVIIIAILWGTSAKLATVDWTTNNQQSIKVSLIQGNIPQEAKWQAKQLPFILQEHLKLTQKHWDSAIIVWPEAAIPTTPENVDTFLHSLDKTAKKHQTTLIIGLPLIKIDQNDNQLSYNAIISVGANHETYLKRHLVPFGEYTPAPLRPLLSRIPTFFAIAMSSFSSGPAAQPPLTAANIKIAPTICYEIAYPYLILDHLPQSQLLLTISDDSWFGKSIAAAQHLEIARMRSLEVGRYQLFSTNTGITAIIDNHGNIITQTPMFVSAVATGKARSLTGKTPWVSYGCIMWGILSALCIVIAVTIQRLGKNA